MLTIREPYFLDNWKASLISLLTDFCFPGPLCEIIWEYMYASCPCFETVQGDIKSVYEATALMSCKNCCDVQILSIDWSPCVISFCISIWRLRSAGFFLSMWARVRLVNDILTLSIPSDDDEEQLAIGQFLSKLWNVKLNVTIVRVLED